METETKPFERNFYRESEVCPKCGSGNPSPKYIPENHSALSREIEWRAMLRAGGVSPSEELKRENYVIPEKVVCCCRCGYEWEAH